MNCQEARKWLDGLWDEDARAGAPLADAARAALDEHVAHCEVCGSYAGDLGRVRAGFRLLREEEAPELSLGFRERVARQLRELGGPQRVAEFFERAGRRFIFATLLLAFMVLMAFVLPASGPVRGLGATDIQPSAEATLAYADPLDESGLEPLPEMAPAEAGAPAGARREGK